MVVRYIFILARRNELKYTKDVAFSLLKSEGKALENLYREADAIRHRKMGDEIYIRGIVEFSNVCANNCLYCGIRASNKNFRRYSMSADEILEAAFSMEQSSLSTIVLQSGEAPGIRDEEIGVIIGRIKKETNLAVTVSVGNRPQETYLYWRECGMDRYFLRFETSNPELFGRLHPGCTLEERLACLGYLRDLGIQTGSGFMIGLPGETLDILAGNIFLCREFDLDMIGIGPYIPHPDTPLGDTTNVYKDNKEVFFKALAVLRIFNPEAHIPATTAFDAVFPGEGRTLALQRGANIFMPNSTPVQYRKDYLLYPGKPGVDDDPDQCLDSATVRIKSLGRSIGKGPGHSIKNRGRGSEDSRVRD
jgi:biotin synthase